MNALLTALAVFNAPFEYWYSRLHLEPLLPIVVLVALDIASTLYGLRLGLREANALMAKLFAGYGVQATFAMRLLSVAGLYYLPTYHFIYAASTAVLLYVVVSNVLLDLQARKAVKP